MCSLIKISKSSSLKVQQFDLEFHHGTKYCDKHRGVGSKFGSGSGNDHMGGTY